MLLITIPTNVDREVFRINSWILIVSVGIDWHWALIEGVLVYVACLQLIRKPTVWIVYPLNPVHYPQTCEIFQQPLRVCDVLPAIYKVLNCGL